MWKAGKMERKKREESGTQGIRNGDGELGCGRLEGRNEKEGSKESETQEIMDGGPRVGFQISRFPHSENQSFSRVISLWSVEAAWP